MIGTKAAPIVGPRTHAAWLGSIVFHGAHAFEGSTPDLDRHCARLNQSAVNFKLMPIVNFRHLARACARRHRALTQRVIDSLVRRRRHRDQEDPELCRSCQRRRDLLARQSADVASVIRIDDRQLAIGPFYIRARKLQRDFAHAMGLAA